MTEFHYKAMSAWSSCAERKEMAHTHEQWRPKGKLSQLDYILGPKSNMCDSYICNRENCATPGITIRFSQSRKKKKKKKDGAQRRREKKWTGRRPQGDEQEEKFKKMVLQKGDGESVKNLATIQENIESAAKENAHNTQKERAS